MKKIFLIYVALWSALANATQIQTNGIADGAVTNPKIANSTINLATKVTGVLPAANGGTGAATVGQNTVLAGPTSGSGAPAFRLLVAGDIPALPYATTALDNLAAVQINSSLLFDTDNTYDVGSSSARARNLYVKTSIDTGANAFDFNSPNVLNFNVAQMRLAPSGGSGPVSLRLYDTANNNFVGLRSAPTPTNSVTYRFPVNEGTPGQVLTTNAISGGIVDLTWATSSGGITQLTGDVTAGPGSGSQAATIANNAVTTAKINNGAVDLTTKVTGVLPIANGGTGASTFTTGSIPFMGASTLDEDNTDLFWDNTGKTLFLGTAPHSSIPFTVAMARTDVDTATQAGGLYIQHQSNFASTQASLNSAAYIEQRTHVESGFSLNGGTAGVVFNNLRNDGSIDDGTVAIMAGAFGGSHQVSTGTNANTGIMAGVLAQIEVLNGNAGVAADFYGLSGNTSTSGTITTLAGIYIEPPSVGHKKNWLSGQAEIGGSTFDNSFSSTLKVDGNIYGSISSTDTVGVEVEAHASTHTTVDGSNNTEGLQLSATATVDSGATNDKDLSGSVNTITRGDGTDDGTLDTMDGTTNLMFLNSGAGGVTNKGYGTANILFPQQGTLTNYYAYYAEINASSGVVTNNYGVYIKDFSTNPAKNWLSGTTQIGGSSYSAATDASVDLNSANKALLLNRVDTATEGGLTAVNGMILYNTDTDALDCYIAGAWTSCATGGGGGANTALSNLITTAINNSLFPATSGTLDIGSSTKEWANGFISVLNSTAGVTSINVDNRQLYNSSGSINLDWSTAAVTILGPPTITSPSGLETFKTADNSDVSSTDQTLAMQITTGTIIDAGSSNATGNLGLTTGDNNGSGNSGDLFFGTGAVTGGTRGAVGILGSSVTLQATSGDIAIDAPTGHTAYSGHLVSAISSSTPPTVSACGTSPSVASGSTDSAGTITVGTGGIVSSCTLTFGTTWSVAPHCFINDQSAIITTKAVPSTTQVIISTSAPFAASSVLDYFCVSNL